MRVRILMALSVVALLSVGVAAAAAAPKQPYPASQQLCDNSGGKFSTKPNSSFYTPFYKKQGVLWTCNMYTDSTATSALVQMCTGNDAGYLPITLVAGEFTCWKNPST